MRRALRSRQPADLAGYRPKGKRFCVTTTWTTITPESAERGDYADNGVDYDNKPFSRLSDAVRAVRNEAYWAHWSGVPASPGDWIEAAPKEDYQDGSTTENSLHVEHCDGTPLRYGEFLFLHRRLDLGGRIVSKRKWEHDLALQRLWSETKAL